MEDIAMISVYNSNLEISIRVAKVLMEFNPTGLSIERIVCIDFLVLNLKDFLPDQESLHPAIPRRDTQLAIKRKIFNDSLELMKKYRIVTEVFAREGFVYMVTDKTFSFTNAIQNEYIVKMERNIKLIKKEFGSLSVKELKKMVVSKFGRLDMELNNG
ncbi:ABC-three component system middle component 2 [Serratia sp. NFX21]|uniref:ABC-three component system middle component 2 n=1 Tax=Serratia sp. NFX21 TaxID=3402279 RepID=UPI003AF3AF9E